MSRYSCPDVADIWSEPSKLRRWIRVWEAASAATGHPFTVDSYWSGTVLSRARQLEAEYEHDVAAACEALREHLSRTGENADAAQWLHYGLCSSDVTDAGLILALRDTTGILARLESIAGSAVQSLAARYTDVPVVYRTHGQAARVGPGYARWHRHEMALARARVAMSGAVNRLVLPAFDGPTGIDGQVLGVSTRRVIRKELGGEGSGQPEARQGIDRAPVVAWAQAVARVVGACEAFGRDVRLLAQTGLGEVSEGRGEGYRGSSSMPHKHNPTRSERLCGIAPVVRGMVNGYAEAASENWDCHSLEHSSAERIVIPQVSELAGFALTEVAGIASSLNVDFLRVKNLMKMAPADSYAERNRLIREGADGGEAWELARDGSRRPGPALS
jgi:adenylosuccinate lyase